MKLQDGEAFIWSGDNKLPSALVLRLGGKEYRADLHARTSRKTGLPLWMGNLKLVERRVPVYVEDRSRASRMKKLGQALETLKRTYL